MNKSLKKIFLLIILLLLVMLTSYEFVTNNFKDHFEKKINMKVTFDYGNFDSGKITTLLNGNHIFFDLEEYSIPKLYPGDYLTITYMGEMISSESYPGIVNTDDLIIKNVEYNQGDTLLIEDYNIERYENDTIKTIWNYTQLKYIILDKELNYCLLSEYDGEQVYATKMANGRTLLTNPSVYLISALFAFDPYGE